jgi:hypothetical protein
VPLTGSVRRAQAGGDAFGVVHVGLSNVSPPLGRHSQAA